MSEWKEEWPTVAGVYWFYGWEFKPFQEGMGPSLCFVEVRNTAVKGTMVYVTKGHFLYKEGAKGLWSEVDLPKLPIL